MLLWQCLLAPFNVGCSVFTCLIYASKPASLLLSDTFPGMWDVSVGGHFTSGESSLQTAIKETQEELGLECSDDTLRFVCTVSTSSTGFTPDHGEFICNEYKVRVRARECAYRVVVEMASLAPALPRRFRPGLG